MLAWAIDKKESWMRITLLFWSRLYQPTCVFIPHYHIPSVIRPNISVVDRPKR